MPGMQFFGTMPKTEYPMAKVLREGIKGYGMGQQLGERRATGAREEKRIGLEEKRVRLAEKKMDIDLKTISYEKKRNVATMVIDVAKALDKSAAEIFVNDPKVKALFEDLDWPLPTGLHEEYNLKDAAVEAIGKGESLPGMTKEETKRAAGILVPEFKITGADVTAFKEEIPWWEKVPGIRGPKEKRYEEMKRKRMRQFEGGGRGGGGDPLGVR